MIKQWKVWVKLNMDAGRVVVITVKANTERKAMQFAKEKCLKNGNFSASVLKCELASSVAQ